MILASEATTTQLIVTVGSVLVALIGAAALIITQGRKTHRVLTDNAGKMTRIEHSINHVNEEPDPLGPPLTLGQLVRQGNDALNRHVIDNRDQHLAFGARLDDVSAELVEHEAVDERIETQVQAILKMRRATDREKP